MRNAPMYMSKKLKWRNVQYINILMLSLSYQQLYDCVTTKQSLSLKYCD